MMAFLYVISDYKKEGKIAITVRSYAVMLLWSASLRLYLIGMDYRKSGTALCL